MSTPAPPEVLPPLGRLLLGTFPLRRNAPGQEPKNLLVEAMADPRTRVLVLADGRAPVRGSEPAGIAWRGVGGTGSREGAGTAGGKRPEPHDYARLGTAHDGAPVLLDLGIPRAETVEAGDPWAGERGENRPGERWEGLREAAEALPAEDTAWFTVGLALAQWHATGSHCPSCGSPTSIEQAGWARRCEAEGTEIFPRTDPAIITAVVHTDQDGTERLLLGHSARWPAGRYSTFAGFVEAGESLESAVVREVAEESGVRVTAAHYLGSQPWPFPRSLMIGFRARAESRETARPDGQEITEVRWFTREELADAVRSADVVLPGSISIAHHLIQDWYGDTLPVPEEAGTF